MNKNCNTDEDCTAHDCCCTTIVSLSDALQSCKMHSDFAADSDKKKCCDDLHAQIKACLQNAVAMLDTCC